MLLNATTLPAVKASLSPLVGAVNLQSPWIYVAFFGLLSPLALYRGPLNPYGIGIGVYLLIKDLNLLPPLALLAAVMSVVQVQTACDPTNTHNVWIANYVGMRVEEITRQTIIFKVVVCLIGLSAVLAASSSFSSHTRITRLPLALAGHALPYTRADMARDFKRRSTTGARAGS